MAGEEESSGEKAVAAVKEKGDGLEGQRRCEIEATMSPTEEVERKTTVRLSQKNGFNGGFGSKKRHQAVEAAPSRKVGYDKLGHSAAMVIGESEGAATSRHCSLIVVLVL